MEEAVMTIGQVARRAGVKASAIRFYEQQGVLPEPMRFGGQRRYTEDAVRRLGIIDVAKQAGFSLDEARLLLTSADAGAPVSTQLRQLSQRKLPELDALIERAEAMRRWLTVATDCGCDSFEACTLFGESDGVVGLKLTHVGASPPQGESCPRVD
jgi:MerR family transcriptional regulator, redox-sensitive transcriptional activator SoxR